MENDLVAALMLLGDSEKGRVVFRDGSIFSRDLYFDRMGPLIRDGYVLIVAPLTFDENDNVLPGGELLLSQSGYEALAFEMRIRNMDRPLSWKSFESGAVAPKRQDGPVILEW